MSNILCIMRRDLRAYFTTPIGYIFMMVFVTLSVGLYITSFFTFPVADMRPYFGNLPIFLCVFIPAVTMRVWAEERKENTWEMLLTFPMQARELVLGKFLASFVFFALTLLATFTIPAMLFSLGEPDPGVILGGYVGTLFLGAFFLSLGIFISGFFKDQVVAFAISLLVAFSLFLVGTDFIAAFIDDRLPGVGTLLAKLLGFFAHYGAFTRGVIDLVDVFYFTAWTVIFLVLNTLYIDGRNRPGAKSIFAGGLAISAAIGLAFNFLITGESLGRVDLTEDKIYTVSTASKNILKQLDTPVQVKVYITPQSSMPTQMKSLEQDIVDKLEEMRVASDGMIEYMPVHMEVANVINQNPMGAPEEEEEEDAEDAIEKRMLDKGVQPFSVQAMSQDEVTNKLVYSSIGIAYKDRAEEIIPQVMPQTLYDLEYRLVNSIYKLSLEDKPVVALVAPKEAVNIDPQMRQIMMQMGQPVPQQDDPYEFLEAILNQEKYDIRRVELTKESPLPEDYDTLAVINPRSLNERQRWEIARALHSGKSVFMAVQNYEWNYQTTQRGLSISRRDEQPAINELLEEFGLSVEEEVLMDENAVSMSVQSGGNSLMAMLSAQPVSLPMQMLVHNSSMNQDTAITNRLSSIFYLWGSPLGLDEAKLGELGLSSEVLMSSSDRAWVAANSEQLTQGDIEGTSVSARQAYPLMVKVEGQFPNPYAEAERPAWPAAPPQQQPGFPPQPQDDTPEPPAEAVTAAPGKLVLIGCSQMFRKNFLQQGGSNLDLFLNSVDGISLDENLLHVRGQKPKDRMIDKPSDNTKLVWRLANYGLANVIIALLGVGVFALRRQSRNQYTVAHINDN